MRLYCFFTDSHEVLFKNWLLPTAAIEYEVLHKSSRQYSSSAEYCSKGWRLTQIKKISYWIKAIEKNMGDIILCSDADVQFLGKTENKIFRLLGENDIIFQPSTDLVPACSGFFACRCSTRTLNLFKILKQRLKNNKNKLDGEQIELNKLLKEKWYIDLKWDLLPHNLFWSPNHLYEDVSELKVPKNILMHHANWTNGVENKIKQLEHVEALSLTASTFWSPKYDITIGLPPSNNPRVCICLSSLLRNFNTASYSMICRILLSLPNKPDLIGHFPSNSKTYSNKKVLNKLKKFCNKFTVVFEDDPKIHTNLKQLDFNMVHQKSGIEGNLLQWHSMKRCAEILSEQETETAYDWVIWSRPDLHFFNNLENINNLDNQNFYTCGHDNHLNGINDRFCLSNSNNVKQRMMIYDYFINKWIIDNKDKKWNAEIVLRDYLEELKFNIKKINLCFGKLRNQYFATVPYWKEVHNTDDQAPNDHDAINFEVLNKISTFEPLELDKSNNWHAVNVLEDRSLFDHFSNSPTIESKLLNPNLIKQKNRLFKILKYFV
jgi:hypothetical protein